MDKIGTVRREDLADGYLLWVFTENDYGPHWLCVYATPLAVTMVSRVRTDEPTMRGKTSVVGAVPCTPAIEPYVHNVAEAREKSTTCPDCGVIPGQRHDDGCDVSRCPECGMQALRCKTDVLLGHIGSEPAQSVWTGEWPGIAECREFDWYTDVVGVGRTEDLNRLAFAGLSGQLNWDKQTERWVKP
jgi:hypothetical protein